MKATDSLTTGLKCIQLPAPASSSQQHPQARQGSASMGFPSGSGVSPQLPGERVEIQWRAASQPREKSLWVEPQSTA